MNDDAAVRQLERRCDALVGRVAEQVAWQLRSRRPRKASGARATGQVTNDPEQQLDDLLLQGEHERARSLASGHLAALATTDRGLASLEVLGLAPECSRLPSGRVNLLQLSRRVARGELALPEVARILSAAGRQLHTQADIHLLCFNAASSSDPDCASRFLRRHLRAYGLPGCVGWRRPASIESVLSGFYSDPLRRQQGPLVSILVPARNAASTLGYALDSLLDQTHACLELLVADDASDDGTAELLKSRYAREPRVRCFQSPVRQGAYNLKNALFAQARGSFVAFHDADDWALPSRIALQLKHLRAPAVLACVGNGLRLRPDASAVFFKDQRATRLSPVSLLLRREAFAALGGFRAAAVGADHELYAKLHARHGAAAVSRSWAPLLFSLWSSASATRQPGTESLEDGYRSPARRAYAELVRRKYELGQAVADDEIEAMLRDSGNYLEPRELVELSR